MVGWAARTRLLASCYRNSLALLREHGLASIAFPAISTGIFGFPPERAARIALNAVLDALKDLDARKDGEASGRVVFCCFGAESRKRHEAAFAAAMRESKA